MPLSYEKPKAHLALQRYRQAGIKYRGEHGLDDSFKDRVLKAFDRAILETVWTPIAKYIEERTLEATAQMLGVKASTVQRWRGGTGGSTKLRNFLLLTLACGIDLEEYPRCKELAISAYREAFHYIQSVGLNNTNKDPITDAEILCLFFTCRNWDWKRAQEEKDGGRLARQVAEDICHKIAFELAEIQQSDTVESPITNKRQITEVLEKYFIPWAILETVVRHDWLHPQD